MTSNVHPIGVFDSGYGGLTVLREFVKTMPQYDFLYLGDNARTPYGTRSFDVVYEYTLQAVNELFNRGCQLVILACNTASAKALRTIQQRDLPLISAEKRVLGVIRPSVEYAAKYTRSGHVGVLATSGTVASKSYPIELEKWSEGRVKVTTQQACPMWVPIVENQEIGTTGAEYFVERDMKRLFEQDPKIDTLILGCTHYPLLIDSIRNYLPNRKVEVVEQGKIVAESLVDYLYRHPEIDRNCTKGGMVDYLTTEQVELFEPRASLFMNKEVKARKVHL
ncbi:glutamate racemase [Mangrovibacterium sp.]|uniref:glutamate racemase n=1 Tax=Mangrovibacterium sp. TaxID=1961364 RepID=UPI003566107F